jgi:glycosyltransferase involved in cell wall biosynthesis
LRILVVSNLYPPDVLGGYEILCHQVCHALEQRGHEILVLTSGSGPQKEQRDGVFRSLRLTQPFEQRAQKSRLRTFSCHWHNYRQTREALLDYQPDVIFFWSQLRLTLGSLQAARRRPALYTLNDEHLKGYLPTTWSSSPRAALGWLLDRTVARHLTLTGTVLPPMIAISEQLKNNLLALGVAAGPAEVVYQGIPLERFPLKSNLGALSDPPRLLYAGQLHHYKGVHTILEALKASQAHVRLTIVGSGDEQYRRHLEKLSDGFDVTFTGRLGHEQLGQVYREHDLFVFPSIWEEPFGLTHLEAMASGLPLISTVHGGQGEFLRPEQNCLAFPAEDFTELARQLDRLLGDADLRLRLCQAGRQTVEEGFTLQRYLDDLESQLVKAARA